MLVLIISVQVVLLRPLGIETVERALLSSTAILIVLRIWAKSRESQVVQTEAAENGQSLPNVRSELVKAVGALEQRGQAVSTSQQRLQAVISTQDRAQAIRTTQQIQASKPQEIPLWVPE